MNKKYEEALGRPDEFLDNLRIYSGKLVKPSGLKQWDLSAIRKTANATNGNILADSERYRCLVAAFAINLIDYHGQKLIIKGFFRKRLYVTSKGFKAELTDMFYRCVFENLNLALEDEGHQLL